MLLSGVSQFLLHKVKHQTEIKSNRYLISFSQNVLRYNAKEKTKKSLNEVKIAAQYARGARIIKKGITHRKAKIVNQ